MRWFIVCILPRFIARWLIWGRWGQRVPLPASWVPYIFGRSIGSNGRRLP